MRSLLRETIRSRAGQVVTARVAFRSAVPISENFVRVTVTGAGLENYREPLPADAFKLHLPARAGQHVPDPGYDDSGRIVWPPETGPRPLMRCFTVSDYDPENRELSFDLLRHAEGRATAWVGRASTGDELPLTGMRTEFIHAPGTRHHLLIGDSSAVPAVSAILRSLPAEVTATAILIGPHCDRELLPSGRLSEVRWARDMDELRAAITHTHSPEKTQTWVCAESQLVREIRRFVLDGTPTDRDSLHAAGYWTSGQDWESTFDDSLQRFHQAIALDRDVTDPQVLQDLSFD